MAIKETSPRYTHDCKACRFISALYDNGEVLDAYVCTGKDKSLILRYGSDGPDYESWPADMVRSGMLAAPTLFSDGTYAVPTRHLVYGWVLEQAKARGHI